MATTPTLTESIDSAVKDTKPPEGSIVVDDKPKDDKPKESTDDKPKESSDKKDETAKNKHGLTDIETEQAMQMFAGLKNPETQGTIIDFLAKQAGYTKGDVPTTKAEAKEMKDDLLALLKQNYGPEFDYLAEKTAPALDRYIKGLLEEATADIREKFVKDEEARVVQQSQKVHDALAKDFFGADAIPDNVLSAMSDLISKRPPVEGMSTKDYVEDIFYSVVGRMGLTKVDTKQKERIDRNRNDAPSRLASQGNREPVPGDTVPKFKNLTEAVSAAVEQVTQREK